MSAPRCSVAALSVTLALGLTACSDESVTVGGSAATAQASDAGSGRYTVDGAGAQLTDEQATSALLTPEDLPEGSWVRGVLPKETTVDGTGVSPEACKAWFDKTAKEGEKGRVARQRVLYKKREGSVETQLQYTVKSYATPEDAAHDLQSLREGTTACKEFTLDSGRGVTTKGTLRALDFERPGDDSAANHLEQSASSTQGGKGVSSTLTMDAVRVQIGHNVIVMSVTSEQPMDTATLKATIENGFRRLEQVAPK